METIKLIGSDLVAIIMSEDSIPLCVMRAIPFLQRLPYEKKAKAQYCR